LEGSATTLRVLSLPGDCERFSTGEIAMLLVMDWERGTMAACGNEIGKGCTDEVDICEASEVDRWIRALRRRVNNMADPVMARTAILPTTEPAMTPARVPRRFPEDEAVR
jgi:hypothetical protein